MRWVVLMVVIVAACRKSAEQQPPTVEMPPVVAPRAVEPPAAADSRLAEMTAFVDQVCACVDRACAARVLDAMGHWSEAAAGIARTDTVDSASERQMASVTVRLNRCVEKFSGKVTEPPVASTPSLPAARTELPKPCRDYQAAVSKLVACAALPRKARQKLEDSMAETARTWSAIPPEGAAALAESCQQAADSVATSIAACN